MDENLTGYWMLDAGCWKWETEGGPKNCVNLCGFTALREIGIISLLSGKIKKSEQIASPPAGGEAIYCFYRTVMA
ncbi:MAG TPA: hypothetical protein PLK12_08665 [Prolixibacteraceae bacterium]|nr:hypothetical protein [Prolixibacteraceae bacterium]